MTMTGAVGKLPRSMADASGSTPHGPINALGSALTEPATRDAVAGPPIHTCAQCGTRGRAYYTVSMGTGTATCGRCTRANHVALLPRVRAMFLQEPSEKARRDILRWALLQDAKSELQRWPKTAAGSVVVEAPHAD